MPENPSLDHELRSGFMKELQAKLESASCFPNLLELPSFKVITDIPAGDIRIQTQIPRPSRTNPDIITTHQVIFKYRVVPDIAVTVWAVPDVFLNNRQVAMYLTETGELTPQQYEWPGHAVKVDRLWDVMMTCGLGYVLGRRGEFLPYCNKCPNQFACLARI